MDLWTVIVFLLILGIFCLVFIFAQCFWWCSRCSKRNIGNVGNVDGVSEINLSTDTQPNFAFATNQIGDNIEHVFTQTSPVVNSTRELPPYSDIDVFYPTNYDYSFSANYGGKVVSQYDIENFLDISSISSDTDKVAKVDND